MTSSHSPLPWLDRFDNPPASHRPMPFFVWNGEVTEERITEMLEQYAARGCGGVFIHPRTGLITEYLSERWFEVWGHALRESERLGLECHIYDENSYPSGFAGGHVYASNPFTIARSLTRRTFSSGPVVVEGRLVAAFGLGENGDHPERLPEGANLDEEVRKHPVSTISVRDSSPRAFSAYYPKVDVSLPFTTRLFLKTTHEEYARRFGDRFGKTIRYCFTDEPNVAAANGLLVSDYLFAEFSRDHGYDLNDRIDGLFFDTPDAAAVRHDYLKTLNRLWVANFLRPIHDWCEQHNLQFTGHFWEHMWPDPGHQPAVMHAYRWMQAPGIDLLAFQFFPENREETRIMLLCCKEVGSVARQLGRERVLCETTGGGGFRRTLLDFKPLTDFCQIYGVNLVNPHLSHQSLAGTRKYDWAQTYSDHSSWWDDYRYEADHEARVCWALTRGREVNRVLVLQPTTTAWLYKDGNPGRPRDKTTTPGGEKLNRMRHDQCELIERLTDLQCDFDLGDEFILEEFAKAKEGKLEIGQASYDCLVLPAHTENLLTSTLTLLESYLAAGGNILIGGPPPSHVEGRPDKRPAELASRYPGQWKTCDGVEKLARAVEAAVPPRIRNADGGDLPEGLSWTRREMDDGCTLHMFANPWHGYIRARIRIEGEKVVQLDTFSGRVLPVVSEQAENGDQVVQIDLPFPAHTILIACPASTASRIVTGEPSRAEVGEPLELQWSSSREAPNQLTLDYGTLSVGRRTWKNIHAGQANVLAWKEHGFESDPWQSAIQFRRTIRDLQFPPDSGLRMDYPFHVSEDTGDALLESLEIAVERPELYRITVNDQPLSGEGTRWWDECMRRFPLRDIARRGENTVSLQIQPFHPLCQLQPLYLLGEFALGPAANGFRVQPPREPGFGVWSAEGLPLFPWTVCYAAEFTLKEQARGLEVHIPRWAGSTIRADLDGRDAGVIAFPPYLHRIEQPLEAGKHRLSLRVRGNVKNAVGPYHSDGHPLPYAWIHSPSPQPPGEDYKLEPSGILNPPVVRLLK